MEHEAILDQDVLKPAVAALCEALGERLVAVVLFGSRARRDATPESDWDLFILAEDLPERAWQRAMDLKRLLPAECRGALSLVARTPQEFASRLAPLYLDIALDGQIIYDPRGYARDRLASLRRLMDRAGLYREHTEAGDVWRWKREPARPWVLEWEG